MGDPLLHRKEKTLHRRAFPVHGGRGGKGAPERIRRGLRTALFVVTMVASLLATSAPALVAVADAGAALALAARLACGGGGCGVRAQVERYGFRSSLMDVPLASLLRSLVITCVYCLSDDPGLSHGPYLGTAALCSLASVVFLTIKACVYTPISYIRPEAPPSLASEDLHSRKSWGMPVLFLTSLLFALGHLVVAYRTRCRARRKLMFHRIDPESVLACKNMFFSYQKVPRSPTPCGGKIYSRSESETKRKAILCCERDLPISFLAESDSLFIACQGLTIHYKLSLHDLPPTISLSSSRLKLQKEKVELAVVLVHGFGGGVFSWRHVSSVLARQVGCAVVAFDRPGWGLTSRPRRKDWEDKRLPNPYMLDSQVDLLISFCSEMGFSSVILVGHDDGGLLALKAAEKVRSSADPAKVEIKGVVLVSVSLSREVVPSFARILLHTPLGKKHMVRPLLRTEITQVINRCAWYDATKLTAEVLNLYKAPLFVEGWDEALHEIGRLSFATVLSSQSAAALLKSAEDLPVLVVAGAEDVLVPFKSVQAMASKLVNSRLIAISGCGHLPHEECPKALLAALTPFITRLLLPADASRRH
uniref:AB hydrolase-1 domain-containing protein n=1 Tax=Ananas comosus var. bracteatus TaxID=296719 RepID=A0A6V7QVJ1_ANACO